MRNRPLRSVTSMPPSGRNARLHGCESPVATAVTRTGNSEVKSVTGSDGNGGEAARAAFCAPTVEPSDARTMTRPNASRFSISRIVTTCPAFRHKYQSPLRVGAVARERVRLTDFARHPACFIERSRSACARLTGGRRRLDSPGPEILGCICLAGRADEYRRAFE